MPLDLDAMKADCRDRLDAMGMPVTIPPGPAAELVKAGKDPAKLGLGAIVDTILETLYDHLTQQADLRTERTDPETKAPRPTAEAVGGFIN